MYCDMLFNIFNITFVDFSRLDIKTQQQQSIGKILNMLTQNKGS